MSLPCTRSYIATLFQPQLSSTEKNPDPIVLAFVQAPAGLGQEKLYNSLVECYTFQRLME